VPNAHFARLYEKPTKRIGFAFHHANHRLRSNEVRMNTCKPYKWNRRLVCPACGIAGDYRSFSVPPDKTRPPQPARDAVLSVPEWLPRVGPVQPTVSRSKSAVRAVKPSVSAALTDDIGAPADDIYATTDDINARTDGAAALPHVSAAPADECRVPADDSGARAHRIDSPTDNSGRAPVEIGPRPDGFWAMTIRMYRGAPRTARSAACL
jgi:hypothetical protein